MPSSQPACPRGPGDAASQRRIAAAGRWAQAQARSSWDKGSGQETQGTQGPTGPTAPRPRRG
jgi:hypothetical protein